MIKIRIIILLASKLKRALLEADFELNICICTFYRHVTHNLQAAYPMFVPQFTISVYIPALFYYVYRLNLVTGFYI